MVPSATVRAVQVVAVSGPHVGSVPHAPAVHVTVVAPVALFPSLHVYSTLPSDAELM